MVLGKCIEMLYNLSGRCVLVIVRYSFHTSPLYYCVLTVSYKVVTVQLLTMVVNLLTDQLIYILFLSVKTM